MKSTPTKRNTGTKAAPKVVVECAPDIEARLNDIATAAYYKAEARGFAPGQELDDWLNAEAELHTMNVR